MSAGPTPPGIDAALSRFRTDGAAMHAALVDLENHPGYRFLDSAALTGNTKTAWVEAKETVAQLFASAAAFRAVLDRAEQVRGKSHRVGTAELLELDDLLRGPSVVLASTEIPLAQRGLTGPATVTNRVSLAELIDTMTAAHRPVAEFVTAAHAVLTAHAARLDDLADQLTAAERAATNLGLATADAQLVGTISWLHKEIAAIRELVFGDPLGLCKPDGSVDTGRIQAVATKLAAARTELAALTEFRVDVGNRIARTRADVDRLATVEAETRDAVRMLATKIAVSGLPAVADSVRVLRSRLATVDRLAADRDWPTAADALAELDNSVAEATRQAAATRDTVTALLDRRAELRGRLDAYQAKAARLGLAEDLELAGQYRRARDLLWTSPCDLAAATRALAGYQRLIADKESNR